MSDDVLVKILCDVCGQLICRVLADTHTGRTHYQSPVGGGMDTSDPRALFCAKHGWPDLDDNQLVEKVSHPAGRVLTHRARMHTRPPTR